MEITSLQNPMIQHWISLRSNKAYREEKKRALLIGEKLIREFHGPIFSLISSDSTTKPSEAEVLAPPHILKKIAGIPFDGWIAEVELPKPQNLEKKKKILILDQIQDPGNMGTLLRTCLAFNWDGVIATPGTVDFFNDKVLRASVGAIFRLPYCWKTPTEMATWIQKQKLPLWIADAKGEPVENFEAPLALLLSHEGKGVQDWAKKLGKYVSIPLSNQVESLNVATAGAILLHQMRGPA